MHVTFGERLGLRHYEAFERLVDPQLTPTDAVQMRNQVVDGLETIQGVRRPGNQGTLLVVDPAFASHRGSASVIAREIPKGGIRLISQSGVWREQTQAPGHAGVASPLANAVDWVDRRIYMVVPKPGEGAERIELDCRQFEIVCRAANGLVSRQFFQADIRRLMARMAVIASGAPPTDEIMIVVNGRTGKLMIDVGNVIQATNSL